MALRCPEQLYGCTKRCEKLLLPLSFWTIKMFFLRLPVSTKCVACLFFSHQNTDTLQTGSCSEGSTPWKQTLKSSQVSFMSTSGLISSAVVWQLPAFLLIFGHGIQTPTMKHAQP